MTRRTHSYASMNDAHCAMRNAQLAEFGEHITQREIEEYQDWAALNPNEPMAMAVWRLATNLMSESKTARALYDMLSWHESQQIDKRARKAGLKEHEW